MWGSLQLLIVLHGVLNKPAPARVSLVHTICDQNGVRDFGNSVPRRLWLVVTGVEWHTHITVDVNYKKVVELHLVYRTDPLRARASKKVTARTAGLGSAPSQHLIPEEVCRRKGNRPKTVQVSKPGFRRWFHATPFSNANLPRFGCQQWGDKIRK